MLGSDLAAAEFADGDLTGVSSDGSAARASTSRPYDMYRDDDFNPDENFYDSLGYRDELPPPGKRACLLALAPGV